MQLDDRKVIHSVSEPTIHMKKHFDRWGYYPQDAYWTYKASFLDKSGEMVKDDTLYSMNELEYNIYVAEIAILRALPELTSEQKKLIINYGDQREERGRRDVETAWAEERAGADI